MLYAFTFVLDELIDDEDGIDALYSRTGDITVVDSDGRTELQFDREASSVDEALRTAWRDVQQTGWRVREVTFEPDSIASVAAAGIAP